MDDLCALAMILNLLLMVKQFDNTTKLLDTCNAWWIKHYNEMRDSNISKALKSAGNCFW